MFPVLLKLSTAYLQPTYYFLPLFLELINIPKHSVLFFKDRGKDSQCQAEVQLKLHRSAKINWKGYTWTWQQLCTEHKNHLSQQISLDKHIISNHMTATFMEMEVRRQYCDGCLCITCQIPAKNPAAQSLLCYYVA